jgi:hypothetical protein
MRSETGVAPEVEAVPPLREGERLSRAEFERRYAAMPDHVKAELLEGVVYMASPVSVAHCQPHLLLATWIGTYLCATPGVAGGDNGTVRLADESEPQPDVFLRILETHGGQTHIDEDGYVADAPELAAEVSVSRIPVDRGPRWRVYQQAGVREYVLWRVPDGALDWFILRQGQYQPLAAGADGLFRSETFPGLWLDAAALLRGDGAALLTALQRGLASPEHAVFVQRLAQEAARRAASG